MAALERRVAKTTKGKRLLKERQPKLTENVKKAIFLKGPKASTIVTQAMKDLNSLKAPNGILLTKRNMVRPMEDASMVEFLGQRNDSSIFMVGTHSKKRPHNLVVGRLFDGQMLDMIELSIKEKTFKAITEFSHEREATVKYGSKPLMLFDGEEFENETKPAYILLKNLLLDIFRGETLEKNKSSWS